MNVGIIGSGHSRFAASAHSLEDLIVQVTQEALADAQLPAQDVDAIFLGNFNAGMSPEAFAASLVHQADAHFRFTPASRCENACASGSAAIAAGLHALLSQRAKIVLVVGAEKMTDNTTEQVTQALRCAGYQGNAEKHLSFPQVFAQYASAYEQRYDAPYYAMAEIAAKNHANAMHNPLAQLHKPLSVADCNTVSDKNPWVAPPIRLTDCSLISDGAAALVLTTANNASAFAHFVPFAAHTQVSDFLPMQGRDVLLFEGVQRAIQQAYHAANLNVQAIDFAEVHDCFTIAELLMYEALGICPAGQGKRALQEQIVYPDGSLPVNLSGGLKAKGHPIGATGVSMHALAFRQLTDRAVGLAKPNANNGIVVNMGGAGVVTYVSILQRRHT